MLYWKRRCYLKNFEFLYLLSSFSFPFYILLPFSVFLSLGLSHISCKPNLHYTTARNIGDPRRVYELLYFLLQAGNLPCDLLASGDESITDKVIRRGERKGEKKVLGIKIRFQKIVVFSFLDENEHLCLLQSS